MQDQYTPMVEKETYTPSKFTQFLWWLSTVEKQLIVKCEIDRNRYAIVGTTVLATWVFASLAWTYFFSTVVSQAWLALPLGLLMGGIILTIDRALIKGINKSNKQKVAPLLFRGILALIIGLFMAQPALIYLFNKEIQVQISVDNEQRKREKRQKQDAVYANQKNEIGLQKQKLQAALNSKAEEVKFARESFIKETDGTGGTKKVGFKEIAKAKQSELIKLEAQYQSLESNIQPQLKGLDSTLKTIETNIASEQVAFQKLLNDGFITRIEALNKLIKDNNSVAFRYYLLVMILLLIELMPVIAKTLLPKGSYEALVEQKEGNEINNILTNANLENQLKGFYNQTAFTSNKELIEDFFQQLQENKKEELAKMLADQKKEGKSIDQSWESIKSNLFSKQEM